MRSITLRAIKRHKEANSTPKLNVIFLESVFNFLRKTMKTYITKL